jgi:1-acyl-sn-glycerol-3-phosphate acyltransferase
MILGGRNLAYHLVYHGARVLAETFASLECEGWDRLPAGACLIAANHQSFLDPPLVGASLPFEIAFVARKSLFTNPVFGGVIRACRAIPLDRDEADLGAIRRALATLAEGRKLLIFPEGTRSADGRLLPAKAGAGLLALRSGVPVVPVRIRGARDVLPRGSAVPLGGARIRLRFGPPIPAAALDAGKAHPERYLEASRRILAAIASLPDSDDPGL